MTEIPSDSEPSQEPVFAFLADPATHGGHRVTRIDTHAASVFLAGRHAFKVKRAVRFAFLDYSTLAKRKAACETEFAINRPYAPEIYLAVLPVSRAGDGTLALGGPGEPAEWAVEMRRFDDGALMSDMAEAGRLDADLADALGRVVAESHARAPAVDAAPWIAALADYIEDDDAAFRALPDLFPVNRAVALTEASRAAWSRLRPHLEQRGRVGLVRRGHGDLHLGNIVLIDRKPVLFDAIEFDPVIASGDTLYDLAFLLMDLIARGRDDAANIVLNRYLAETRRAEDIDALSALPLFLSLRAAIRAKVTAARREQATDNDRRNIETSAHAYFDLACRAIAPPAPRLVAIGGLSGTGKSVLARALAPDVGPSPGAVLLRSDVERKAMFGVSETERLPPRAYEADVTANVYAALAGKARRVIAAGHSAVVDSVFARHGEREEFDRLAAETRAAFTGLFLSASLEARVSRVAARTHDASDADARVATLQQDYDIGALGAWHAIDASGTPDHTLAGARVALAGRP